MNTQSSNTLLTGQPVSLICRGKTIYGIIAQIDEQVDGIEYDIFAPNSTRYDADWIDEELAKRVEDAVEGVRVDPESTDAVEIFSLRFAVKNRQSGLFTQYKHVQADDVTPLSDDVLLSSPALSETLLFVNRSWHHAVTRQELLEPAAKTASALQPAKQELDERAQHLLDQLAEAEEIIKSNGNWWPF